MSIYKKFINQHTGVKFFIVGILNTIFGCLIYTILIWSKFNSFLALLFSMILGVFFNFKTFGALVFKSNDNSRIFRFFLIYISLYLFNNIVLYFLIDTYVNRYLAGFIVLISSALISYFLNLKFVFKKDE